MKTFSAYVEWDPESKLYVGVIPGVPGAHSQGRTLDELYENLKEVLTLCIEAVLTIYHASSACSRLMSPYDADARG